jgi:protein TonB
LKQRIRNALQTNLIYPYIARKQRLEGTVLMEFRINGRGMPEGVRIVKGSSYAILDEAARETVLKASPFPAINNIIEVPIRFSLRGD